jgi:hypothetical protein
MSELQRTIVSKVKNDHTHTNTANYWAPLEYNDDEEENDEEESGHCLNMTKTTTNKTAANISDNAAVQRNLKHMLSSWINQRIHKDKPFVRTPSTMVVDSGATSNFVRPEEKLEITGTSQKVVMLPDGSAIQATHTALLPFESLSPEARKADVLPGLRPNSLVSVGKLADANYTTIFHPQGQGVTIHERSSFKLKLYRDPVLQGWRDANGLWRLSRDKKQCNEGDQSKTELAASVYGLPSIAQTVRYLHAAAGFPVKDTWIKAIKNGNYNTWPGITPEIVSKHFPESVETQKGHLKKQRQNVRSTRKVIAEPTANEELTRATTKQNIMIKVINAEETIYTDQSGRFPIQSSRGYTSLMVYYDVDANCIDVKPLRNHSDNQMIPAYKALWERTNRGRNNKPKMHILDNEASNTFKAAIKENCDLQLVPPDTHRRNLAERAIQTFKSHFIAILAGVDPSFPMNLWDRLLSQTVATLNLLRQSNKNPTISAYQHVYGIFDYNKTPFGPLGCAVEMHESANRRKTWDPRSISGWYLGTSMEHYRCHIFFAKPRAANEFPIQYFFDIGTSLNPPYHRKITLSRPLEI